MKILLVDSISVLCFNYQSLTKTHIHFIIQIWYCKTVSKPKSTRRKGRSETVSEDRKVQCHGPQHEFFSYTIVEEFLHVLSDQNNDNDLSCLHMQCKIWLKKLKIFVFLLKGMMMKSLLKKKRLF